MKLGGERDKLLLGGISQFLEKEIYALL